MTVATLREAAADIVGWFGYSNERSWWAHALQGLIFGFTGAFVGFALYWLAVQLGPIPVVMVVTLLGIVYTHGAFSHREVDNWLQEWLRNGWRAAKEKLLRDGWQDYAAPMIAAVVGWMAAVLLLFGS